MSFRPSISVIVPTYNRIDSLIETLDAIFAQTYPINEVIVADDGSTDDTVKTLRKQGWEKLKVLELEHSGLPAVARNAALKSAQGDWIAFCDSDDIWAPNKLINQIEKLDVGDVAVCSNATTSIASDRRYFTKMPGRIRLAQLLRRNWIITSSLVVKKETLKQVGGFPESPRMKFVEDYATWLKVAYFGSIAVDPKAELIYKEGSDSSHRDELGSKDYLLNPVAWVDFMGWMRQRGHPLTLSENAINVAVPRAIATNLKLIKKSK